MLIRYIIMHAITYAESCVYKWRADFNRGVLVFESMCISVF